MVRRMAKALSHPRKIRAFRVLKLRCVGLAG